MTGPGGDLLSLVPPCESQPSLRITGDGDAVDYCQCNRGPVIGVVVSRPGRDESRLVFFLIGSRNADHNESAADLRCLDCVAEAVADLASGKTHTQVQETTRQRQEELRALAMRAQISAADRSRQSPPAEEAGMT